MEQKIITDHQQISWEKIAGLLKDHNFPVEMRMIDGELAFPDESPPDTWQELRVGTAAGMITLRKEADSLAAIVWENADADLRQAWNALVWACAEATGGNVLTPNGEISSEEYKTKMLSLEP